MASDTNVRTDFDNISEAVGQNEVRDFVVIYSGFEGPREVTLQGDELTIEPDKGWFGLSRGGAIVILIPIERLYSAIDKSALVVSDYAVGDHVHVDAETDDYVIAATEVDTDYDSVVALYAENNRLVAVLSRESVHAIYDEMSYHEREEND